MVLEQGSVPAFGILVEFLTREGIKLSERIRPGVIYYFKTNDLILSIKMKLVIKIGTPTGMETQCVNHNYHELSFLLYLPGFPTYICAYVCVCGSLPSRGLIPL